MTKNNFHLDFRKIYFPHPVLDNYSGEPTIEGILRVTKQLKHNTASVPTTLGGGKHGYLVLILTTARFEISFRIIFGIIFGVRKMLCLSKYYFLPVHILSVLS